MTPLERAARDQQMSRSLKLADERMLQMRIAVMVSPHQRARIDGNFIPWEPSTPSMIDAMLEER